MGPLRSAAQVGRAVTGWVDGSHRAAVLALLDAQRCILPLRDVRSDLETAPPGRDLERMVHAEAWWTRWLHHAIDRAQGYLSESDLIVEDGIDIPEQVRFRTLVEAIALLRVEAGPRVPLTAFPVTSRIAPPDFSRWLSEG